MFTKAYFLLLAVAVFQVSAAYIEPEFIENVKAREEGVSQRIVSGWEAVLGQHPHHAALRMVDAAGGVSACGGSFVHREWVITAAHCTALRVTLVIRGGVVDITTPEYISETTQWWNYPTYNDNDPGTVQVNDISIVKLQRAFTTTDNLKPIRIQSSADAFRDYNGETLHASGHGRTWTNGATTEILRWVYLRGVSNPSCGMTFGTALINQNAICAQWFNVTSQSTCQGDSGGPLVHVGEDGVDTLIGVTSFVAGGDFGCHSGFPAGFIRPGPFLSWFQEITGIDFENLEEEEDITEKPEEEGSGEDESNETDEDSSESDEDSDEEMSQLLKRLSINVKVKVSLNKYKFKKELQKDKEIRH